VGQCYCQVPMYMSHKVPLQAICTRLHMYHVPPILPSCVGVRMRKR
jgi:hypothetical protein